jgi:hypothetical protein
MRMEDVDFAFATCEKSPLRNSSGPRTNVSLRGSGLKPGQTNFESFSPYFVEWKQQHDHGHPQTSLELYGIRTSLRLAYPAQQPTRSHYRRRPGPTAPHHDRTHRQTGPSLIRTHRTATHPRTSSPMPPDTGHGRFIFLFIYFLLCVSSHSRPRSSSPSLPPSRSPLEPPLHGGQPRVHHHRRLTYRRFCTQAPVAGTATRWPLATAAGSRTGAGGTRRLRGSSRGSSSSL